MGESHRRFEVECAGQPASATLTYRPGEAPLLRVEAGGAVLAEGPLGFGRAGGAEGKGKGEAIDLSFAGERTRATVHARGEARHVFMPRGAAQLTAIDRLAHAGEAQAEGGRLTAPMPGKVVSFAVRAGDRVAKGQALAVMEAMKMEHTIAAPADGMVEELLYAPGDQVTEGAELLRLAAAA